MTYFVKDDRVQKLLKGIITISCTIRGMVERSFETAVWHPFFKMFVSLIQRYYNTVNLTFFTILYTSWYKRFSRWSLGIGSTEMPAHWPPSSCFSRYSSGRRTKWICPSRELLLIWHMGHKCYSLNAISSHHMHLPVAQSVGPVPFWAISKKRSDWGEIIEVKHKEFFPFYLVHLSGRLQGWHTQRPRLKTLSSWNQWDFCHWLLGKQDFYDTLKKLAVSLVL